MQKLNSILFSVVMVLLLGMPSALRAGETTDWSDSKDIVIPEPRCAYVNITGIDDMPKTKTENLHAWMEFNDNRGNTFRKRIILNAQGNSSLSYPKKNLAFDLCDDEWIGDDTPSVTFGDWVSQDGFHLKANYIEYFRGQAMAAYRFYDDIISTLPSDSNRPWKRAGIDGDDNAVGHPNGFPCVVSLNGTFYGVYALQLKKHRKNMNMKKSSAKHIQLDGTLYNATIFEGDIKWDQFEIRNPKTLYCMDGTVYDGDHPKEIIDESSPYYAVSESEQEKSDKEMTAKVKKNIVTLANAQAQLRSLRDGGADHDAIRQKIADILDVQSVIDYYIFSLAVNNNDGFMKNWQWVTYDGKHWSVMPYDLDSTFGSMFTGEQLLPAKWGNADDNFTLIDEYVSWGLTIWVIDYYWQEIKARYAELRAKSIISTDNIASFIEDWTSRIPAEEMKNEWQRWPDSKCINPTIANDGWQQSDDYTGFIDLPTFNYNVTYQPGDRLVIDRLSRLTVWEATKTVTGVFPYQRVGYTDSLERVRGWIKERISLTDNYFAVDWHNMSFTTAIVKDMVQQYLDNADYSDYNATSVVDKYCYYFNDPYSTARLDHGKDVEIQLPTAAAEGYVLNYADSENPESVLSISIPAGSESVSIPNLYPHHTYTYTVSDADGKSVTDGEFTIEGHLRMLHFDTGCNMRDIGGWTTTEGKQLRHGLIYRGAELGGGNGNTMNAQDLAAMKALGIGAELDMRYYNALKPASHSGMSQSSLGSDVSYCFLDMYDHDNLLFLHSAKIKKAVSFILEQLRGGTPVYVHCTFGADRTGTLIATLEGAMGVTLDNIFKDYELTSMSKFSGRRIINQLKTRFTNRIGYDGTQNLQELCHNYFNKTVGISTDDINDLSRIMDGVIYYPAGGQGDANLDGSVSVTDIVVIADYILGNKPTTFSRTNADVNGDGEVTVTDIVQLANMILTPFPTSPVGEE